MGKNASMQAAARAKARARRRALDQDRTERDRRIENAATSVFLALNRRTSAREHIHAAEGEIGETLRALTHDGLTIDNAARMCDLDLTEARRLARLKCRQRGSQTA